MAGGQACAAAASGTVEGEAGTVMGDSGSQQGAALARDDLQGKEEEGERLESEEMGEMAKEGNHLAF